MSECGRLGGVGGWVGEVGLGMGVGMVEVGECMAYGREICGDVWWVDGLGWGHVEGGWKG